MKKLTILFAAMALLFAASQQISAADITCHFYIPAAQGFLSEDGGAVQWHYEGSEAAQLATLTADETASNWYTVMIPKDEDNYAAVVLNLLNATTAEAATQTVTPEYAMSYWYSEYYYLLGKQADGTFFIYQTEESYYSQYPNDYLPYNLSTSQNEDTLFVAWESQDTPYSYDVYVYDYEGRQISNTYVYNYAKSGFVTMSNAEPTEVTWSVRPNVSYYAQPSLTAYSEPFTKSASPKVAKNLQAVENPDGTYTFSWQAAESPAVKKYQLTVQDPNNSYVFSEYNLTSTSVTRPLQALFSGKYTMHVYSFDERGWNQLGETVDTFEVAPVAAHDITVRIMINPLSGIDTSAGVQFDIEKTAGNTETVDATVEPYGWYSYSFNTTERGARVGVRSGYYSYVTTIYGDTCIEYTGNYLAAECDARATDYQPHDILASKNDDGTYTISWLMDATERVSYYSVYVYDQNGQNVYGEDHLHSAQIKTGVLSEAGTYSVQISVYEEVLTPEGWSNTYRIGFASSYFEIEAQTARDITVRVLPQPGSEEWLAFIYNTEEYDYTTQVPFALEGEGPWYTYTFTDITDPAVSIRLKKASDIYSWNGGVTLSFSEDGCVELDETFQITDCSTALKDYTISSLGREDLANGQMTFSWQCAAEPERFVILINDAEGNTIRTLSTDGQSRSLTTAIVVDSTMATVNWSIYPVKQTAMGDYMAYGQPFSLTASPYVPRNIVAVPNGDGRWTVTWDPIDGVSSYTIYNSQLGYTTWVNGARYVSDAMYDLGYVTITITPQLNNGQTGVSKSIMFEIQEVEARDITVRLLIHPDASNTYAGSLRHVDANGNQQYVDPVEEGSGWYTYTFSSTMPAPRIYLMGYQENIAKDTCFEYISYLSKAACDAEPHDYRIAEGSLQALSTQGKAIFSWAPLAERATSYNIQLMRYNSEYDYWTSFIYQSVYDTCFVYYVPENMDGVEVRWSVYPQEPHNLYNSQMDGPSISLQKSIIELTNLRLATNDSLTYTFTWDSNTDTIRYEMEISQGYYGNSIYSVIQSGKSASYTFISGAPNYNWRVRPVNASGEPLADWVDYGESFYAKSNLRAISNLQGSVSGRTLNFSWTKSTPYVSAYLECETAIRGYVTIIRDTTLSGNNLSVEATEDGRYIFHIEPLIVSDASVRVPINEEHTTTVNVFSEQTYAISISATKGGILMDDVSGNYPAGYVLYPRIRPEEGYEFVGWSDGSTDRWRAIVVEGDLTLIALFEKTAEYEVSFQAGDGGAIIVDYAAETVNRFDTTVYSGYYFNIEAVPADGYGLFAWSDGADKNQLNRGVDIHQDTTIQAIFRQYCSVTVNAAEGGRVQVSGDDYQRSGKTYTAMAGTVLTLKADPDEGYRFSQWSDGDRNVLRTYTVSSTTSLTAQFEEISTPLAHYTLRVLTSDPELGSVSQVSGTYTEGDQVTISAIAAEKASFLYWSDGNSETTRVITISQDTTLTATFAIKQFTLTIAAEEGGTVNSEVNGVYEYGAMVMIQATPNEGYQFAGWSDGYSFASRSIEMTSDINLTALFAQETFLITFLNADGALLESNRYAAGEIPACSVIPTMDADEKWIYTFAGWDPEIVAVTANAVYTAVYTKEPAPISAVEETSNPRATGTAQKILHNGVLYIIRDGNIYTIQGVRYQ